LTKLKGGDGSVTALKMSLHKWQEMQKAKLQKYPVVGMFYECRHRRKSYYRVIDIAFSEADRKFEIIAVHMGTSQPEIFQVGSFWSYFKPYPMNDKWVN
jgi:hypothetical protein